MFGLRRGGGAGIGRQAEFFQFVLCAGKSGKNFPAAEIEGMELIVERGGVAELTAARRVANGQ